MTVKEAKAIVLERHPDARVFAGKTMYGRLFWSIMTDTLWLSGYAPSSSQAWVTAGERVKE